MKNTYDNQLSITDDLNDFPVIFHEIKPSDFLTSVKKLGFTFKSVHHKINFRSHQNYYVNSPKGRCTFNFKNCYFIFKTNRIRFCDFNQPYFKTR